MAVLPYDRSPSRFPVWLGAGGITVLVVLGIVVIGLPLQCNLGLSWDNSCPAGTAGAATMRPGADVRQLPANRTGAVAPKAILAAAKPQNLVAATFGRLGSAAVRTALASAPVATSARPASELATRVVKTLAVGPDGAVDNAPVAAVPPAGPVPLAVAKAAPAVADPAPADMSPSVAAVAPVVPAPLPPRAVAKAVQSASVASSAVPSAPAASPAVGSGERVVGGSGVSVRSLPGHNGTRLFALSAGEHVTVSGTEHGWLHVTDAKGQTGWAYSSFFHN